MDVSAHAGAAEERNRLASATLKLASWKDSSPGYFFSAKTLNFSVPDTAISSSSSEKKTSYFVTLSVPEGYYNQWVHPLFLCSSFHL